MVSTPLPTAVFQTPLEESLQRTLASPGALHRILVPISRQPHSRWALNLGIQLALDHKAQLGLLHVRYLPIAGATGFDDTSSTTDDERTMALEVLRDAQKHANQFLRSEVAIRSGFPSRAIVEYAKQWQADLIVIGQGEPRGLGRLFGSRAQAVARLAPCPVLIVRQAPPEPSVRTAAEEI